MSAFNFGRSDSADGRNARSFVGRGASLRADGSGASAVAQLRTDGGACSSATETNRERVLRRRRLGALAVLTLALTLVIGVAIALAGKKAADVFGSQGAGNGQLNQPRDVAVNEATDEIYVVEQSNHRISVFDQDGGFVKHIGSQGTADGQFAQPQGIAIDQDTGKIYVGDRDNRRIQRLNADGTFDLMWGWGVDDGTAEAQVCTSDCEAGIAGAGAGQIGSGSQSWRLDVSKPDGNPNNVQVFVADPQNRRVQEFTPDDAAFDGTPADSFGAAGTGLGEFGSNQPLHVAVDADGIVYASDSNDSNRLQRYDTNTNAFRPAIDVIGITATTSTATTGLEEADGSLYVARSGAIGILELDLPLDPDDPPTHSPDSPHASNISVAPQGLGLNAGLSTLYLSTTAGGHRVFIIRDVSAPVATISPVTDITDTSATLNGEVNPNGASTQYRFEYSDDAGASWTLLSLQSAGAGSVPVSVSSALSGLKPNTDYLVRLFARHALDPTVTDTSATTTFTTDTAPPLISSVFALDRKPTSVSLTGRINPSSEQTTYWFEWGPTPSYGNVVPAAKNGNAGSGDAFAFVSRGISGLQPETTYHFRLIAENATGRTESLPRTFTTPVADCPNADIRAAQGATHLPDCMAWELVSPPGSPYSVGANETPRAEPSLSADGSAVAFVSGYPLPGATAGSRSAWRSTRSTGGWQQTSLLTPDGTNQWGNGLGGADTVLRAATPDGSTAVYYDSTTEPHGSLWVVRADGSRVRIADASVSVGSFDSFDQMGAYPGQPWAQVVSDNGRHVLFTSVDALVPGVAEHTDPSCSVTWFKMTGPFTDDRCEILYEWVDDGSNNGQGTLRVVSRTNDPSLTLLTPGAARVGGTGPHGPAAPVSQEYGRRNAVSVDGSRIFFQTPAPTLTSSASGSYPNGGGPLYVREDGAITKELSAPAPGHTPDSPPTKFQFLDASEDGSLVFFWADGDLTEDAPAADGIYRYDLDSDTLSYLASPAPPSNHPGVVTALASADGSHLYFEDEQTVKVHAAGTVDTVLGTPPGSSQSGGFQQTTHGQNDAGLTSEIGGLRSSECPSATVTPDGRYIAVTSRVAGEMRTFRYDAATKDLEVVSPPAPASWPLQYHVGFMDAGACLGNYGTTALRLTKFRMMSDDGSRIYFNTAAPLVPGDSNRWIDTYQWHDGEISLVTSGTGKRTTAAVGTDASGETVVFATEEPLVGADTNDVYDLYVARAGGGFPEPARAAECDGDGCQGDPETAPSVPDSATLNLRGAGNARPAAERCEQIARRAVSLRNRARVLTRRSRALRRQLAARSGDMSPRAQRKARKQVVRVHRAARQSAKRSAQLTRQARLCRARGAESGGTR
jgi:hypothetical protein